MKVLAIETSCDETAMALLEAEGGLRNPRFKILKNIVSSQIKIHAPWGGVVPSLAKREHIKNLPKVFDNLRLITRNRQEKVDLIAVTVGPGLEPALWAGIGFAKEIHKKYFPKAKLIGANHLEGHLYSFLLAKSLAANPKRPAANLFPAIALIVSGGHTILLKMDSLKKWEMLGETVDDAAGEAYDKAARMLGLPYPGGSEIERLARKGNPNAINFPRPMLNQKNYNFSFSGLKTAVLYYLRDNKQLTPSAGGYNKQKADVAASFQAAAIGVLVKKTLRAAEEFGARSVMLSGGVAANGALRGEMLNIKRKTGIDFFVADLKYNTDNAVMMAVAGYMQYLRGKKRPLRAQGSMRI